MKTKPKRISASRRKAVLRVEWEDGREHEYPFGTLRAACPCADCRASHEQDQRSEKEDTMNLNLLNENSSVLEGIERVGNYAIQLVWRDGHRAGIYPWDYLYHLHSYSVHGDERKSV